MAELEEIIFRYTCDKCNYKCKYDSEWNKHCETELHKTGIRKKRSDIKEPLKCKDCPYKTKNKTIMNQHILNEHSTKEERKLKFRHYCSCCDFGTFSKDLFSKHNNTDKHNKYVNVV